MKFKVLFLNVIVLLFFVSCSNQEELGYDLQVSKNKEILSENLSLQKLSSQLEEYNKADKIRISELEEEVLDLRQEIYEINNEVTQDIEVIPLKDYLTIDGGNMRLLKESNLLSYKDETYISFELIGELYGVENPYGYMIKGLPIESNYVLGENGIVHIEDYLTMLEKKFNQQEGYDNVTIELEGLRITYGEVGLIEYVITSDTYMTQRGITIGSTRDEVRNAYGQLGLNDSDIWHTFSNNVEYSEGNAFSFLFKQDKISEIRYGWKR